MLIVFSMNTLAVFYLMRFSLYPYNKSSLFLAMLIVFSMNTPSVFLT
jgi:hypothetical protein